MHKIKLIFLLFFFALPACNTYQVPMVANYQQIPVIHVQKNDTLYSLAKRYDTTAEALAKHNGIDDPTELQPGTSLNVPRTDGVGAATSSSKSTLSGSEAADKSTVKSGVPGAKTASSKPGITKAVSSKPGGTKAASFKQAAKSTGSKMTTKQEAAKAGGKLTRNADLSAAGTKSQSSSKINKTRPGQTVKTTLKTKTAAKGQQTPEMKKLKKPFVAKGKVNFAWPLKGKIISNYGGKGHGVKNDGINIAVKKGTPIKAAESGIVVYAGNELKGYGNLILLKHEKNFMTAYAHADTLCVDVGDVVDKGQKIGAVGQTGNVKSPQLHFEVRHKTKAVDPKKYLH